MECNQNMLMVIYYKKKSIRYETDKLIVIDRYMEDVFRNDISVIEGDNKIVRIIGKWIVTRKFSVCFREQHNYKVGDKVNLTGY